MDDTQRFLEELHAESTREYKWFRYCSAGAIVGISLCFGALGTLISPPSSLPQDAVVWYRIALGVSSAAGTGGGQILYISNDTNQDIRFRTNATTRWIMQETGHFTTVADNAYDFGASGATRPRSIYWGTQALGPDGAITTGNVSYSFASDPDSGLYSPTGDHLGFVTAGVEQMRLATSGTLRVVSTIQLGAVTGGDVILTRDAANQLAQRNGTTAQQFNIYETFTNSTNYERGTIHFSGNVLRIGHQSLGTGSDRSVQIITAGAARWEFSTTSDLIAVADNSSDIGADGATRPRSIYVGTHVEIGTTPATAGDIRLVNGSSIQGRNAANDGDIDALRVHTDDIVYISNGNAITLRPTDGGLRINNQTDGAGASTGTLGNAPGATDPDFWLPINIAGVAHVFPCWTA